MGQDIFIPLELLQPGKQVRIAESGTFDHFCQAIMEIPPVQAPEEFRIHQDPLGLIESAH